MKNIEKCFFHGIDISTYDYREDLTSIKILELILKSEKLLTRNDLIIENPELAWCLNFEYSQKINEVCLAYHPNNDKFNKLEYQNLDEYCNKKYKGLDAYYDWILYKISIIFSERMLIDKKYHIIGLPREIRVTNSIELRENIAAIGYHDKITKIIKDIENLIEIEDYYNLKEIFWTNYYHDFLALKNIKEIKKFVNNQYKRYNQIKELLTKYNYDIPIIDPFTGKEHNYIDDSIINAEKILCKRRKIIKELK